MSAQLVFVKPFKDVNKMLNSFISTAPSGCDNLPAYRLCHPRVALQSSRSQHCCLAKVPEVFPPKGRPSLILTCVAWTPPPEDPVSLWASQASPRGCSCLCLDSRLCRWMFPKATRPVAEQQQQLCGSQDIPAWTLWSCSCQKVMPQ